MAKEVLQTREKQILGCDSVYKQIFMQISFFLSELFDSVSFQANNTRFLKYIISIFFILVMTATISQNSPRLMSICSFR